MARSDATHSRRNAALRRFLRQSISLPEIRTGAHPGVRLWWNGARRIDVPARGFDPLSHDAQPERQALARVAGPSRTGAPVVRRPRNHAMVRRSVVERGIRELHGFARDGLHL